MISKQAKNKLTFRRADMAVIAVFLGFILVIGLIERLIPLDFIVPGARLGLSNIVILTSLYIFPRYYSVVLVVLKCLLLALLAGGPSSFFYSIGGSMLALAVMALLIFIFKDMVSPIGVSVAGAMAHSIGQVSVSCIILENIRLFSYLPLLGLVSIASGILVGVITAGAVPRIKKAIR